MYYSKKKYRFIEFEKSPLKNKKYRAILQDKKNKKYVNVDFGDKLYENYHDKTGLNLYSKLLHGDKKRRKSYRARHKVYLKDGFYSPGYFSFYYLW